MVDGKRINNKGVTKKMWETQIQKISKLMETMPEEKSTAIAPTREQFTRLLSSPFSARRIPGIPGRLSEEEEYHCTEAEAQEVKAFLLRMFQIDSKEKLEEHQRYQFIGSVHYEQFMTFWKEAPLFDVGQLNEDGRRAFEASKSSAEEFYPLLEERGFYAWDISEYLGLCRVCFSAGGLSKEEYAEITDHFVRKAQVFYHSFKEYALSYLCGGIYFMSSHTKLPSEVDPFLDIQTKVIESLFQEGGPWSRYSWYRPAEREWAAVYPGNPGCFMTKAAFEKGIGYMYREEGSADHPDTGWRFFHGDESDEYVNNVDNIQICSINTVLNLRPDILAYVEAPVGSAYGYTGTEWVKDIIDQKS